MFPEPATEPPTSSGSGESSDDSSVCGGGPGLLRLDTAATDTGDEGSEVEFASLPSQSEPPSPSGWSSPASIPEEELDFEEEDCVHRRQNMALTAALRAEHALIYSTCIVTTQAVLGLRSLAALFMSGSVPPPSLSRPNARLTWDMLSTAAEPCRLAREALPVPPPLPMPPPEGWTISFGPCANLMIYTGGIAACLQRCPNYAEVSPRLRFYGVSCGAFMAASMAADRDIFAFLPEMIAWTKKFQGRLWGLIGAYSESIVSIARDMFSDPASFERASKPGRLGIGVTAFTPKPTHVQVNEFSSADHLVTTLCGSCYIPVAFEQAQWSRELGPLWDGGILEFATQGDIVASPYDNIAPDICPESPYPKRFTFFPPHECDAVRLFEDGYMDCMRWLQAGAPSRRSEREAAASDGVANGLQPLLVETRRFLWEVCYGPPSEGGKS